MIDIEHLSYQYAKQYPLFNKMNVQIQSGHIYGLLGKNGAGKSTLLKIIAGLLFPKDGVMKVVGETPKERTPSFLQEIYLITEEIELPAMRVFEYINLYSSFYPRFDHKLMDHYLQEFELAKDLILSSLSYGQKKKFSLSFGLATDCKLLLLDEPTIGLDIPSKSLFRRIVANSIHEGRTFIISTHQVRDMENLIDPIIILDEGELIFYQNREGISKHLCLSKYMELPPKDEVIYAESKLGGYSVIIENVGEKETNIPIEMLFNAVVNNKNKMNQIFNK